MSTLRLQYEQIEKRFWMLKITRRERRELLLVLLLLAVAMLLLNASFDRAAEKAVIKAAEMTVVTHHDKM
jgi:hypothetical protein